ncbi:MAG: L-fuculose-phosphate aldolase [Deltaproteobacteria bacterium]|nr:MAG: L-fuculose-phosphate aldolase [Deltaproteobacteria bacterium]
MLLENERRLLVECGKKLITHQLTTGTGGNLSILNREDELVAITPTGLEYFETTPEDIVVLRLDGELVDGKRDPSSELPMHRFIYQKREDIDALVHVHSMYATTLSCLNWELPAVHYMVALAGNNVRCAQYATFGSEEMARNAFAAMRNRKAVFLANHGLLAGGKNLPIAFAIAEQIEFCAEIYYRSKCIGEPIILSDTEMEVVAKKLKRYGATKTLDK